jgi:HPt (histidine-containing phosphotransfer) domain-containing protein
MTNTSFELSEALALAGDETLLRELAGILLEEGSRELGAVRSAQQGGDPRALEAAAHRLKGAVIVFGAKRLGAALEELEQAARGGSVGDCGPLVTHAESEWRALASELEAWLGPTAVG